MAKETDLVVEVQELAKAYGTHRAVEEMTFSVRRGEIFGVVGSNGAGKTTAVECAQGIRRPDSGRVSVLGLDPISDRKRLRGRVGSQLQDSHLPDRMKVAEAVTLFANDRAQAATAIEEWELHDLLKVAFGDLSGGQQQRLFLALALLNKPEVVFLDELTQGLDPNARRSVWRLVEQVRDRGTTVVLVTHLMEEAELLCDRMVVVGHGRVLDSGSPSELVERHAPETRMRFGVDPSTLDWLEGVCGVDDISIQGNEAVVSGASPMIAHVGAAMVGRGDVPSDIRIHQPNLEDALLKLFKQTEITV